jgi:hypothetical protein
MHKAIKTMVFGVDMIVAEGQGANRVACPVRSSVTIGNLAHAGFARHLDSCSCFV